MPQTRAEIELWNWGKQRAQSGLPIFPDESGDAGHPLDVVTEPVLEAISNWADDTWSEWVAKGWNAGLSEPR